MVQTLLISAVAAGEQAGIIPGAGGLISGAVASAGSMTASAPVMPLEQRAPLLIIAARSGAIPKFTHGLGSFHVRRTLCHGHIAHPAGITVFRTDINDAGLFTPRPHGIAVAAHRHHRRARNQHLFRLAVAGFHPCRLPLRQFRHPLHLIGVFTATRHARIARSHDDAAIHSPGRINSSAVLRTSGLTRQVTVTGISRSNMLLPHPEGPSRAKTPAAQGPLARMVRPMPSSAGWADAPVP